MTPELVAVAPRQRQRWGVIALAVVVLAACFAYATSRAEVGPAGGGTVTYVHEGGFAGGRRVLTVTAEGKVDYEGDAGASSTWQIDPSRVEDLHTALDAARFGELERSYRPGTCLDCFVETITYRGHSVTVEGHVRPPELAEALQLLSDVAGRD